MLVPKGAHKALPTAESAHGFLGEDEALTPMLLVFKEQSLGKLTLSGPFLH